jgi:hypothetical protein
MRLVSLLFVASLAACSGSSDGGTDLTAASAAPPKAASSCTAGDKVLATQVEPNTELAVSDGYVWYRDTEGANDVLARVPLAGGAPEIIEADHVGVFAVNAAGDAAYALNTTPPSLVIRTAAGVKSTPSLPDGAHAFSKLAVDKAGNVFVMTDWQHPQFGTGTAVWRWSAERKVFDQLHRVLPQIEGFYPDGGGIAWAVPSNTGGKDLFHEDAEGGAPVKGPSFSGGVIALGANAIYTLEGNTLRTLDRATGKSATTRAITGNPGAAETAADDTYFYWLVHDRQKGDARIMRAPLDGSGVIEVLVETSDLVGAPRPNGCGIAYLGVGDDGNWAIMSKGK